MIDAVRCDRCGAATTPCFSSDDAEAMRVRVWWCQSCGHVSPATGRERAITLEQWIDRGAGHDQDAAF